jgi:hypothetical protein
MNFSDETLAVLKNFSTINSSVVFKPGTHIKTISPSKTVMAVAKVAETFDRKACIYDINRFIAAANAIDDVVVEFDEKQVYFRGKAGQESSISYASENLVIAPPEKEITLPSEDAKFKVDWEKINYVISMAGVFGLPEIAFKCEDSTIYMLAVDSKNDMSDTSKVIVATDVESDDFLMTIKKDNFRLMPADYEVVLSSKGMAYFSSNKVQYWIAIDYKK